MVYVQDILIILQKKKDRECVIRKSKKLTSEEKDKWLQIVCNEFMSSEESEGDDSLIVHSLPWRSKLVTSMFEKIDQNIIQSRSSRSKRQKKARKEGPPSSRSCPPAWAIQN